MPPGLDQQDHLIIRGQRGQPPDLGQGGGGKDGGGNRRRADIDGEQVQIGAVRGGRGIRVVIGPLRAGKGGIGIGIADQQVPRQPLRQHRIPVQRFGVIGIGARRGAGADPLHLFARHG